MSATQEWLDARNEAVSTIASVLEDDDHKRSFAERQAQKIVANKPMVVKLLTRIDDPQQKLQLRQQRTVRLDDQDQLLEEAAEGLGRYRWAMDRLKAMGSPFAAEWDPDERGADEDTARISAELRAEKAKEARV